MNSRNVGDYEWRQLSMWDFAPAGSVQMYLGEVPFHFYLTRVVEVSAQNRWRVETTKSLEGVPEEVLTWRGGTAFVGR